MAFTRRDLLKNTMGALGAVVGTHSLASICTSTPSQNPGPYYPKKDLIRDNDLTRWGTGKPNPAWDVILIQGQVMGTDCKPITGAHVEIWQAAPSGRYNHSGDPNVSLKLDPDFQYWGRTVTDSKGGYTFKTIVPGHYPLDPMLVGKQPTGPGQFRPPHIHFKVRAKGHLSLTTQMYFDPKSYDDKNIADVVSDLNGWESVEPQLTVLFAEVGGVKSGTFDIVLG